MMQQLFFRDDADLPTLVARGGASFQVDGAPVTLRSPVSIDIETCGIQDPEDALNPRYSRVVMASAYDGVNVISTYDPEPLRQLLVDASIMKVSHNAAFEQSFFNQFGYETANYHCTQLMAQVLYPNSFLEDVSLKALANRLLGVYVDKSKQTDFGGVIDEAHVAYNQNDAVVGWQLYNELYPKMVAQGLERAYVNELTAIPTALRAQHDGIYFDDAAWIAALPYYEVELDLLGAELRKELKEPGLKLSSNKKLLKTLNDRKIPVESLESDYLALFSAQYPVLLKVIKWRELNKLLTSYKAGDYAAEEDGRVHGFFNVLATRAARMTSEKPNLQQVHHLARPFFKPHAGNVFVYADFSQAQLRALAQLSHDMKMIRVYRQGGDLHQETSLALFGVVTDPILYKRYRDIAKTTNFAIIYGAGVERLRGRIMAAIGIDVGTAETRRFINTLFNTYTGVRDWRKEQMDADVIKSVLGRRWVGLEKPTQKINYAVQSLEAEGYKASLGLIYPKLSDTWRVCNLVHDSVLLECPRPDGERALEVLCDTMKAGMETVIKSVPVVVDGKIMAAWG